MGFKERLRIAIDSKGVTPYMIGRDTSVSKESVGGYLSKGTMPGLKNIAILANYLGVSVKWLIEGEEDTPQSAERQKSEQLKEENAAATGLRDRLFKFIEYKGLDTAAFERSVGLSNGSVYKMGDGTRMSTIDKISEIYPDLSVIWLRTGDGEMIFDKERKGKTISVPQTAISETKRKGALIYDIDGTCGSDGRSIEFTDERVIGSIDVPGINPNSQIIFATGDSMQPLIYSGDRIVIRKIESWDYFNYGQVHLIITNEHRFIKRIRKHPKDEDSLILLRSENPEFDDIPLPKKEIVHLYIVENILSIKNVL